MGLLEGFLDFRRVDSMPGDMPNIVQIPFEALHAVQHKPSIYKLCIYNPPSVLDASRPIVLRLPGPKGGRTIHVRLLSDDEWIDCPAMPEADGEAVGPPGASETTVANREEADAVLFVKIRKNPDDPDNEAFEAVKLIEELAEHEVDDVVPVAKAFGSPCGSWAATVQVMKMPSALLRIRSSTGAALCLAAALRSGDRGTPPGLPRAEASAPQAGSRAPEVVPSLESTKIGALKANFAINA